jgi:ABC-type multidrug transport system fused ATPase/permease subunit
MAKVILTVLLVIVAAVYGAMFVMWNMEPVSVVGFVSPMDPDQGFAAVMPLAFLAVIGVVIGVVVMGVAAWGAWTVQHASARQAQQQLSVAKQKLQERTDLVRRLRADLDRLKASNGSENVQESEAATSTDI